MPLRQDINLNCFVKCNIHITVWLEWRRRNDYLSVRMTHTCVHEEHTSVHCRNVLSAFSHPVGCSFEGSQDLCLATSRGPSPSAHLLPGQWHEQDLNPVGLWTDQATAYSIFIWVVCRANPSKHRENMQTQNGPVTPPEHWTMPQAGIEPRI